MGNRDFSDSIKLEVIKNNLKKNNGSICCEICHAKLNSIEECHFDHIYAYIKGGKSTLDNCQILCEQCNLRKNDKELQDFVLEEKAKQFLAGKTIDITSDIKTDETIPENNSSNNTSKRLSKEEFDRQIQAFIDKKGDIHKVDFTRAYNKLPSIWYVKEFYGDLNTMKKAFGIEDLSLNWSRERIVDALKEYVSIHGDVKEKDLKKSNKLPSYPCILKYFPEHKTFTQFKKEVLGLKAFHGLWTKEEVIAAGKSFIEKTGEISEKDLCAENDLPTSKVIYGYFGSMAEFQKAIGAQVHTSNAPVTKQQVIDALNDYFKDRDKVIESRDVFFQTFPYAPSTINRLYGPFLDFCSENGITVINAKIASYSKKDIDDAVHNWVFNGNDIPKAKELTKLGLPSMSSIMKYYESWRTPFVIYKKIYDEANRNKQ